MFSGGFLIQSRSMIHVLKDAFRKVLKLLIMQGRNFYVRMPLIRADFLVAPLFPFGGSIKKIWKNFLKLRTSKVFGHCQDMFIKMSTLKISIIFVGNIS